MTNRRWERGDGQPFVAYLVFDTTILVKDRKGVRQQPYTECWGYTQEMLERREAYGRDVPPWYQPTGDMKHADSR